MQENSLAGAMSTMSDDEMQGVAGGEQSLGYQFGCWLAQWVDSMIDSAGRGPGPANGGYGSGYGFPQ